MSRLHRYIIGILIRNVLLGALTLTTLFLLLDFFDRIDNLVAAGAAANTVALYFILKIPLTFSLILPVAMLVGTLFTFGILSRNSEITAMRAAGIPIRWIARPLIYVGLFASLFSLTLNETLVPYTAQKVKEIYNIDIKQKDKTGTYSQEDFWWRDSNTFYSVDMFDSRTKSLINLSSFEVDSDFKLTRRTDSDRVTHVDDIAGWNMHQVEEYHFTPSNGRIAIDLKRFPTLPLPIMHKPQEFYDVRADRHSMSFRDLRRFIKKQRQTGLSGKGYLPDLYEKISFPFVNLLSALVVLPFALKPARSGSMAVSVIAGLAIGFTYYAVHYFSLALGRAELWPPLLAAWMANIVMGAVALVLNAGTEAPN